MQDFSPENQKTVPRSGKNALRGLFVDATPLHVKGVRSLPLGLGR
jgi:hypothetical protein